MDKMTHEGFVPKSLPPPYTATGSQSNSLRAKVSDFTSTTTLLIGPKATRYLLHTTLLTSQSPYFRACLSGPYIESTTQSVTLDDVSPETFELLISWLYTGSIDPLPFKDGKPAYYTLLHLYILADRLCFEGLRNAVVDAVAELADRTNSVLTPSDTRILYEMVPDPRSPFDRIFPLSGNAGGADNGNGQSTGNGNVGGNGNGHSGSTFSHNPHRPSTLHLKKLVLDLFAYKKTDKLLESHEDQWHAQFLRDLVVLMKRPSEQAFLRHRLVMWYPTSYISTHACENCRVVIPPRFGAVRCEDCCVAWCSRCVGEGTGMAGWEDGVQGRYLRVRSGGHSIRQESGNGEGGEWDGVTLDGSGGSGEDTVVSELPGGRKVRVKKWQSCKPWRGARCAVYHEHAETERCGDVFMGH